MSTSLPQHDAAIKPVSSMIASRRAVWLLGGGVLALAFYLASSFVTPPSFHIDEASVAYNATTIARAGVDEHGARAPLYFRAFGEYKNPLYIYLLAALYKITGPSLLAARLLSALLGFAAALLLGWLAARVTGRGVVGIAVAATALVTPWLFEVSRLVFEVTLFPLALVLFLLALERARHIARWSWRESLGLGATLALLTYSYSIGRLFAPLLALGLLLFINRERIRGIVQTWLTYAALLIPLFIFLWRYPGALNSRFGELSYITPASTWGEIAVEFIKHYLNNLHPLSLLLDGDAKLLHHVPGMGSLLAGTFVLAAVGLAVVIHHHRRDAWWRFVVYGLVVSVVPASLTKDDLHTLRLIPFPIFLLLLTAAALAWLLARDAGWLRRAAGVALLLLTLVQAAVFQRQFYGKGMERVFDLGYQQVFDAAWAAPNRPLCVVAGGRYFGYVQAYWLATLRGWDTSQLKRITAGDLPPAGAAVISEGFNYKCAKCPIISDVGNYLAYVAP